MGRLLELTLLPATYSSTLVRTAGLLHVILQGPGASADAASAQERSGPPRTHPRVATRRVAGVRWHVHEHVAQLPRRLAAGQVHGHGGHLHAAAAVRWAGDLARAWWTSARSCCSHVGVEQLGWGSARGHWRGEGKTKLVGGLCRAWLTVRSFAARFEKAQGREVCRVALCVQGSVECARMGTAGQGALWHKVRGGAAYYCDDQGTCAV